MNRLSKITVFEYRNENSKVVEIRLEDQNHNSQVVPVFKTGLANMYNQLQNGDRVLYIEGRNRMITIDLDKDVLTTCYMNIVNEYDIARVKLLELTTVAQKYAN